MLSSEKKKSFYIGIDPDSELSGVAVWNFLEKKFESIYCLTFFNLFSYLKLSESEIIEVVIEAGWLNGTSNWHRSYVSKTTGKLVLHSVQANEKIAKNVGANHETGRKIVEMCAYLKIPCRIVRPTRSKVDAEYFRKVTGYNKPTNPEKRDAGMLVYGL